MNQLIKKMRRDLLCVCLGKLVICLINLVSQSTTDHLNLWWSLLQLIFIIWSFPTPWCVCSFLDKETVPYSKTDKWYLFPLFEGSKTWVCQEGYQTSPIYDDDDLEFIEAYDGLFQREGDQLWSSGSHEIWHFLSSTNWFINLGSRSVLGVCVVWVEFGSFSKECDSKFKTESLFPLQAHQETPIQRIFEVVGSKMKFS